MRHLATWQDARRHTPRIFAKTFCTEVEGNTERAGLVVDLSADGLRIERPYTPGLHARRVGIEFELPDIDEVMWANTEICFDQVSQAPPNSPLGGQFQLIRTTGFRIVGAASIDLRRLKEFTVERWRQLWREQESSRYDFALAACYARG